MKVHKGSKDFRGLITLNCVLLTVAVLIAALLADKWSANQASIAGGILSSLATIVVGTIAVWQNKRYEKLAKEANDRIVRPEIFLAYHGLLTHGYYNLTSVRFTPTRWLSDETMNESFLCACEVLDFPILKVIPLSLEYVQGAGVVVRYTEFEDQIDVKQIIRKNEMFRILLPILTPLRDVTLTIQYENIYGDKYIKTVEYKAPTELEIPDAAVHGTYASGQIFLNPAIKLD